MSSCDGAISRRCLLLGLAVLPACGFTPVYGPGGSAEGLRGQIAIGEPSDVAGFKLVRQLETRLGQPLDPQYDLRVQIELDRTGLGVTDDSETVRLRLRGVADYTLTQAGTGAVLTKGQVSNFTSYAAPVFTPDRVTAAGNMVSVRVAAEDALDRLMIILADQMVSRLLLTAPEWRL